MCYPHRLYRVYIKLQLLNRARCDCCASLNVTGVQTFYTLPPLPPLTSSVRLRPHHLHARARAAWQML